MRGKMKTALSGSRGRMGKALRELMEGGNGFQMTDQAHRGRAPELWNPKNIDGVIDFSLPQLFSKTLSWCVTHKKPLVSGTTGLNARHKKSLQEAGQVIPVFYAENMSRGIWLLKGWIKSLTLPPSFQIVLEDIHHKNKKDRPSGTALRLKAGLPSSLQRKVKVISERRGREFGTHRLILKGGNEEILLQHRAFNRKVFAEGALKALKQLKRRPPGLYSVEDIYGGNE